MSAHDAARELRSRLPGAGAVVTHKLLYYAQGWHLAFTGAPLFSERIRAWANGPVVARLWRDERDQAPTPPRRDLVGTQLDAIDYVAHRYGSHSGRELIGLTHTEEPWRAASAVLDAEPEITHEALLEWFRADEAFTARAAEVQRHRDSAVFSFEPQPVTTDVTRAIEHARSAAAR